MTTLYSHPISQHCRRVLALLNETGIPMEIRHVSLDSGEHMSADYLAVNPNHQVPSLVDGDVKIHESNTILRYLCQKHGLTDWYPEDLAARAAVDQWLDWTQCRLGPATFFVVFNTVFAGDQADAGVIALGHSLLEDLLPVLDAALAEQDYIAGKTPTIADLALASNITHLALADAAPEHPHIVAWIKRVCRLPGFRETLPMEKLA
jgi:glutathione S-transferase